MIAVLLLSNCSKEKSLKNEKSIVSKNNLPYKVINNWTIYNDKNKLPVEIKEFLNSYNHREFEIANPNEKFNTTDVMQYKNAPFRQLRLLENKNDIWRMVYVQGGIGKSTHFFEFEIQGDTISNIKKGYSFENIETNDSLEYYIKKGKVNFEKINIKYDWTD